MLCPNCGERNIPGVDICEGCGTDLAGLDLPEAESGFQGKLLNDRIGELELSEAVAVQAESSVADAVRAMREAGRGCTLVFRDGRLAGIFNERDVVARVLSSGLDAEATPVTEVMTPDPVTLSPTDPPAYAVHCMVSHSLRHLPVVENDRVLGYISVRNILRYIHRDVIGKA